MNAQAQNALLKTLEEPAGRTLIILLTDQPGVLLPTVRSRCQLIRFAALDEATVKRELQKRGIDKSIAADAVRFAEGSLGQALRWIEDGVIDRAQELEKTIDSLATTRATDAAAGLPEWFKSAADAYAAKQLERDELASKDQLTREGLILYLRLAAMLFRQRLATDADRPDQLDRSCDAIDAIVRAEQFVDANVNIALIFQQLAIVLEGQAIA
jgi:hypothetical protein